MGGIPEGANIRYKKIIAYLIEHFVVLHANEIAEVIEVHLR